MSALAEIFIKTETLKTLFDTVSKKGEKGEKGVKLTVSINDETNQYGQNVTSYVSQTKEQREAKANKFYAGNGQVFWTNGSVCVAKKEDAVQAQPQQSPPNKEEEYAF